ncbi:MAG: inorganic diphosphatase [Acidobacteria bacterium]|nr:inorganic diphosphatase [Acidobacteriota bacterium]
MRPSIVLAASVCIVGTGCASPVVTVDPDALRLPPVTRDGLVHAVIEIPAGTNLKWEIDKDTGALSVEQVGGAPRVVDYLGYPGNYGIVPGTLLAVESGGDGDPLDVLVLGPAVPRGTAVLTRPVAILRLQDSGARDDKLICVLLEGPLSDVTNFEELRDDYPGVLEIIETWFVNYKGPGRIQSLGFENTAVALEVVQDAVLGDGPGGGLHD